MAPELPRAEIFEASHGRSFDNLRLVAKKILPYPIVSLLRLRHNARSRLEQIFLELKGYSVLNLVLLFRKRWPEIHRAHTLYPKDTLWNHKVGLSFIAFPPSMQPPEIKPDWIMLHFSQEETDSARRMWQRLLGQTRIPPVVLNPVGQRPFYRRWPIPSWRQLAEVMHGEGYPVVILGGTHPELAQEIAQRTTFKPHILTLKDVPQIRIFAAMLPQAAIVVTVDGGVSHIANAAGATVLALHGPTAPEFFGPYFQGEEKVRTLRTEYPRDQWCAANCANAFSSSSWPGCRYFPAKPGNELLENGGCMHLLNPELVLETVKEMLG